MRSLMCGLCFFPWYDSSGTCTAVGGTWERERKWDCICESTGLQQRAGSRVESSWHGETEGQSPFAPRGVWDANWGNNMRLPALVFPLGWRENGWETKNEYRSNQGCKA